MKIRLILFAFVGMTLLAVLSTVAITRQNPGLRQSTAAQRHFDAIGKILAIDAEAKTVRIAHQEIPGYMPAMTMPFPLHDSAPLRGLRAGQRVNFRLAVTDDDCWITRMEPLPAEPIPATPLLAKAQQAAVTREVERLQAGERVPDLTLIDQDGRPVHLSDFKGKGVVLTFIYTRCPIPNFCPLMSKNFACLQQRLQKAFAGRYHLLSVSFDPAFDTPEVLKAYAARYEADPRNWTFATGTPDQIDFAADLLGLTREPENGLIAHDLRTALISPEGKLVQVWKSNVWTPFEVERSVRQTFGGH